MVKKLRAFLYQSFLYFTWTNLINTLFNISFNVGAKNLHLDLIILQNIRIIINFIPINVSDRLANREFYIIKLTKVLILILRLILISLGRFIFEIRVEKFLLFLLLQGLIQFRSVLPVNYFIFLQLIILKNVFEFFNSFFLIYFKLN